MLAVMAAVMRAGEQDGEPQGELLILVPPYDSSKVFFPSYALKAAGKGARCAPGPKAGPCSFAVRGCCCACEKAHAHMSRRQLSVLQLEKSCSPRACACSRLLSDVSRWRLLRFQVASES